MTRSSIRSGRSADRAVARGRRVARRGAAAVVATLLVACSSSDGDEAAVSSTAADPTATASAGSGVEASAAPSSEASSSGTSEPTTTVVPSSAVTPDTAAPVTDAVSPSTDATSSTTAATEPTAPVAPSPGSSWPLSAIDDAGDAVWFSDPTGPPLLLADGADPDEAEEPEEGTGPVLVDSVGIRPDATRALVGTCCEPISGVAVGIDLTASGPPISVPTGASTDDTVFGYAPTYSPDGSLLARGVIDGAPISVLDVATQTLLVVEGADELAGKVGAFSPYDVIWLDGAHVAVVGIGGDPAAWSVVVGVVEAGSVTIGDQVTVAPFDGSPDGAVQRFAGRLGPTTLAVHEEGASQVVAVDVEGSTATVGATVDLDGPARSAWLDPVDPPIVVDPDGRLLVGDRPLDGAYARAARR